MKLLFADKRQLNITLQLPAFLRTTPRYRKSPRCHAERSEASRHCAMLGGLDSSAPPQNDNPTKSSIVLAMIFTITLLLANAVNAQQDDWLSYYPSVSRLQGKLTKVSKYGKPSYGENPEKDEKVEVAILILQTPDPNQGPIDQQRQQRIGDQCLVCPIDLPCRSRWELFKVSRQGHCRRRHAGPRTYGRAFYRRGDDRKGGESDGQADVAERESQNKT